MIGAICSVALPQKQGPKVWIIGGFILGVFGLSAQTIFIASATEGLTVYTEPNFDAPTVGSIPYGERITLNDDFSRTDTLRVRAAHFQYNNPEEANISHRLLPGNWRKLANGYAFDAYLAPITLLNSKTIGCPKIVNSGPYAVLRPNYHCGFYRAFDPSLNWYGVYQHDGVQTIRRVSVRAYLRYHAPSEIAYPYFFTEDDRRLQFVIGSPHPLPEGTVDNADGISKEWRMAATIPDLVDAFGAAGCWGGVLWQGDMNGDGRRDYLVVEEGDTYEVSLLVSKTEGGFYPPARFIVPPAC